MSAPFRIKVSGISGFGPNKTIAGEVLEGSVEFYQRALLKSPAGSLPIRILTVEVDRKICKHATRGQKVAVQVSVWSFKRVADGFAPGHAGRHVADLEIHSDPAPPPWWAFWS
jgi:hypothetical protein